MTTSTDAVVTNGARDDDRHLSPALAVLLAVWFLIALAAGAAGVSQSAPSRPPLPLLAAVAGPPLLFTALYRESHLFRGFVLRIDLRLLTAIQSWRVIGRFMLLA